MITTAQQSEEDLVAAAQAGDEVAADLLCKRLQRWVYSLAMKFQSPQTPVDDLVQEGMLGLMQAVERFVADGGRKFRTFAVMRVRGHMLAYCREKGGLIHNPRGQKNNRIHCRQTIEPQRGESDDPSHPGDEAVASEHERIVARRQLENLQPYLRGLSPQERMIVLGLYVDEITMREIGEQLGMSESRVSQSHASLLGRIRARIKEGDIHMPQPVVFTTAPDEAGGDQAASGSLDLITKFCESTPETIAAIDVAMANMRRRRQVDRKSYKSEIKGLRLLRKAVEALTSKHIPPPRGQQPERKVVTKVIAQCLEEHGALTIEQLSEVTGRPAHGIKIVLGREPERFLVKRGKVTLR